MIEDKSAADAKEFNEEHEAQYDEVLKAILASTTEGDTSASGKTKKGPASKLATEIASKDGPVKTLKKAKARETSLKTGLNRNQTIYTDALGGTSDSNKAKTKQNYLGSIKKVADIGHKIELWEEKLKMLKVACKGYDLKIEESLFDGSLKSLLK